MGFLTSHIPFTMLEKMTVLVESFAEMTGLAQNVQKIVNASENQQEWMINNLSVVK